MVCLIEVRLSLLVPPVRCGHAFARQHPQHQKLAVDLDAAMAPVLREPTEALFTVGRVGF